jgi:Mn-dependent DtxR family transcriptional regulator
MIRNTRLLEVLMRDALKIEIDEEMVCGIEHHMKDMFTEALCTLLNHPRLCPHGHDIPNVMLQEITERFYPIKSILSTGRKHGSKEAMFYYSFVSKPLKT